MFGKKEQTPTVEVTNDSYARWLRAGRPDFFWFLGLSEINQEQLAVIGDEYIHDVVVAAGYAVRDPDLAQATVEVNSGQATGEEAMARRMMDTLIGKLIRRDAARSSAAPQRAAPGPTMAGFGSRASKPSSAAHQLFGAARGPIAASGDGDE